MHINIFYIYNISIWMHIYDTIEVHAHVTSTARFYFIARASAALLQSMVRTLTTSGISP